MRTVAVTNLTRQRLPRFPYAQIARAVAGDFENLSVVFLRPAAARALNKKLRGKSYTPNVLSYLAGERNGEIIICPAVARKEAPRYGRSFALQFLFLFIHGLLHLKGCRHGATMERRERTLLKKWGRAAPIPPHVPTHRHRH